MFAGESHARVEGGFEHCGGYGGIESGEMAGEFRSDVFEGADEGVPGGVVGELPFDFLFEDSCGVAPEGVVCFHFLDAPDEVFEVGFVFAVADGFRHFAASVLFEVGFPSGGDEFEILDFDTDKEPSCNGYEGKCEHYETPEVFFALCIGGSFHDFLLELSVGLKPGNPIGVVAGHKGFVFIEPKVDIMECGILVSENSFAQVFEMVCVDELFVGAGSECPFKGNPGILDNGVVVFADIMEGEPVGYFPFEGIVSEGLVEILRVGGGLVGV